MAAGDSVQTAGGKCHQQFDLALGEWLLLALPLICQARCAHGYNSGMIVTNATTSFLLDLGPTLQERIHIWYC